MITGDEISSAERKYRLHPLAVQDRGYANAEHLAEANLRIIDATFPNEYAGGHVTGAVNLNGFGGIPRASDGDMASPDEFADLAGNLGVSNDTTVAVYDSPDQRMEMVAWAFLHYGHSDVRIFRRWTREMVLRGTTGLDPGTQVPTGFVYSQPGGSVLLLPGSCKIRR